jgi:hypothetical protein
MLSLLNRNFCLTLVMVAGSAVNTSAADAVVFRGMDMGTSSPPASTADPNVVLTRDTAHGELTHVGRYNMTAQEFINSRTLAITGGQFTIVAANGDTLTGTYSGSGKVSTSPGVITYDVAGPITSGTGRFANASGVILFRGTADLVSGKFTDQVVGLLLGWEDPDARDSR